MKTLVIHPLDVTTGFLEDIYYNKGYTELDVESSSNTDVINAIKAHDRIMMLGHGTEEGLYSSTQGYYVISYEHAPLLQSKVCVGIWCYASRFAIQFKLKGLFTEMMISEIDESYLFGIDCTTKDIQTSNSLFSSIIAKYENGCDRDIIKNIKQEYFIKDNNIVCYNRERIYYL